MSIVWKNPKGGQCCECTPGVCDPCSVCPTADSIELTVSGIAACCSTDNTQMTGLGAINGVHSLALQPDGSYMIQLSGAVTITSFLEADCTTPAGGDPVGPYDVTIGFSCTPDVATLDIRMTDSETRLFYAQIVPPSEGGVFVFTGAAQCSASVPYTYSGTASIG